VATWPATKASKVLAALKRIGWKVKRQAGGSHKILERSGWPDYVWAWHDGVELGPAVLARIAKSTGLNRSDF
jgi:predicted RNA binding protein YcfA (HicA-like mRNA interferase family)